MITQPSATNVWGFRTRGQDGAGTSSSWKQTLLSAFLTGALLGTGLTAVATSALDRLAGSEVAETSTRTWPARPIPREWRWSPPGVNVDHMFRKPAAGRVARADRG